MFLVTKQDVCRYYKEDFWGELIKEKRVKKHLNRTIFGKPFRSRRARKNYKSSRYEVIKLDNRRFQKKRRIPKSVIRYHNVEKVRLYYSNMDEYGLRAFIMLQRGTFKPTGNRFVDSVTIHDRLGYRLDHLIFLLNWAPTLSEARKKILNGYFQINNFIPTKYDFVPTLGDELKVRARFKQNTFRYLKKIRNKRSLNVRAVDRERLTYLRIKKYRRKIHVLRRKRRRTNRRYLNRLKKFRSYFLRTYAKKNRKRVLNQKRWNKVKTPYGFFPRSFLPKKYSIVQNRFIKFRNFDDYSTIGRNSVFNNEFFKPQLEWHAKFGKFFFKQFLERYNGKFFLYKSNFYYKNETNFDLNVLINPLTTFKILNKFKLGLNFQNFDSRFLLPTPISYDLTDVSLPPFQSSLISFFIEKKEDVFYADSVNNDSFLSKFKFMFYRGEKQDPIYRTLIDHFTFLKTDLDLETFDRDLLFSFSPIFDTFKILRNLAAVVEQRAVFNTLWARLYLGRLRKSNFIRDAVKRLSKSKYSVFKVLDKKFRYKLALAKFAAITKSFGKAVQARARIPKIEKFYPSTERSEHIVPVSNARFTFDFSPEVLLAQDNVYNVINDWVDGFLVDLSANAFSLHAALRNKNIYTQEQIRELASHISPAMQPFVLDSILSERESNYFIEQLIEPTTPLLVKKEALIVDVGQGLAKSLLRANEKLVESHSLTNVENENSIDPLETPSPSVIDVEFNQLTNKFIRTINQLSHKFEFYPKLMSMRRKIRGLNRVLKPRFRKLRKKRRRTLLLRSFSNLLVSYRLLKVIFLGYRKVRRKVTPFFYFPCKFSLKPFLNYFGCKPKMKSINKKETVYVQKPRLPFNLPKINKKKFGMMQQAISEGIRVTGYKHTCKRLALRFS